MKMNEANKIYWASAISCSCGTFLGNFIYHAMQTDYNKGVVIGLMASLFVFLAFVVGSRFRTSWI